MCSRHTSFTMLLAAPSVIPAYAAERHSHCTNMLVGSTPQKHPSYWTNILGGLEEHLASWTKGLGRAPLAWEQSARGKHPSEAPLVLD